MTVGRVEDGKNGWTEGEATLINEEATFEQRRRIRSRKKRALTTAIGLTILILIICFPKGGIKIGTLPITFSYAGLVLGAAATTVFRRRPDTRERVTVYLLTLPLAALACFRIAFVPGSDSSWSTSLIVTVAIIPALFILFLGNALYTAVHERGRIVCSAIALTCLFGIADFCSRNLAKIPLEIPYLTVNADDFGKQNDKNNNRGAYIKLISTYGNGNIFGVCFCMLGPLMFALGAKRWQQITAVVSIFLTLSRTAWAGLVVWAFLWQLVYKKRSEILVYSPAFFALASVIGFAGTKLLGFDSNFVLDTTLGGRLTQEAILTQLALISNTPFVGVGEMTYVSFASEVGVLGLLLLCLWLWSPIVILLSNWQKTKRSRIARACLVSMTVYVLIAAVDGAFLLIPVMAIYWTLVTIALCSISQNQPAQLTAHPILRRIPSIPADQ